MKIVTNKFKNQIKTAGRMLKNTITCEIDNVEITINDDSLYSIKYSTYGSLLKSVMRMLEFEIDTDIPLNTVLTCQISMKANNEWETLNFGEFIVSDTEIREESGHYFITCYDKMLYSMVDYESMNITYPITIRNYIGAICTKLGLTFKNVGETFANYDKEIPNELYLNNTGQSLGYTFRDVLDELAQVTASAIWINENGELELKYINNTSETFDGDSLKNTSVSFKDKFGPINSIVLSRSGGSDNVFLQDEQSIQNNGLCEIKIEDNQIMNDNNRSDYLPDILEVLDGTEYYVNDFQSTGILYLELYDKFNVIIGENTYPCIILNDEIDLTNGLEEHVYSEIPNTSETDYKHASKDDRQRNQAYIIAKKNEAEINALASKIVDVSNTISGTHTIQLENAHEGILHRLEITGNLSATFPSNDLYPSDYLYPSVCGIWVYNVKQDAIDWETSKYYVLDFLKLNYINDSIHDTYVYEDGKQWVERNVGIDEFGNKYALSETVIEQGKDIEIRVEKESYITMYPFGDYDNAMFKCTYLLENEYTSTFANQVEVTSELNLLGDELEAKVSSVADEDGNVTSASLILAINKDESGATLNADKVDIEANDVLNILAGNEINMTTKNLSINSDNFSVDSEGNTTMRNANITGGSIELNGDTETPKFKINSNTSNNRYTEYFPNEIRMWREGIVNLAITNLLRAAGMFITDYSDSNKTMSVTAWGLSVKDAINQTSIEPSGIITPTVTQTSKEEYKKNFEKLENAKEILKNTDIYKYNLKSDKDTDKKHIGFVIGDKYNYSKEITSKDNDGVDIYSMVSVLWQVVKEQEEEIKLLKERIDK